jgi:hypothetical protein
MHPEFTQTQIDTFWRYVEVAPKYDFVQCWPWTKSVTHNGYGQFGVQTDGKLRMYRAHRLAYLFANGSLPEGKMILHTCHNRRCCNPLHLYAGTAKQNTADMLAIGRHNRPHAVFTDDQIRTIRARVEGGELKARLAEEYGVWPSVIGRIVKRETYRHVTN